MIPQHWKISAELLATSSDMLPLRCMCVKRDKRRETADTVIFHCYTF